MSALRHRDYALVWSGQIVSAVGDGMRTLALMWWAKTHGGSNALVVAVAAASSVPVIVASPVGGWLADRLSRRRLLVGADLQRGVVSALLAVALFTDRLTAAWLVGLVAMAALGTAMFEPTFAAATPTLVPDEARASANGLMMANSAAGGLAGPLLGGVLVAAFGPGWVLAVDAVSFAVSAVLVGAARVPRPGRAAVAAAGPAGAGEQPATVREVLADPLVRRLGGLATVLNLVAAPIGVLLVALAVDRHHVGAGWYGVLQMAVPAGLLVGALAAGRLADRPGMLRTSLLVLAAALVLTGATPFAGALGALMVAGAAIAVANTVLITTLQRSVAPEVQGRAFGVLGSLTTGLRPLGLAGAGPLLAAAGVTGSFTVVGLGVALATLTWARHGLVASRESGRDEAMASGYRVPSSCS